MKRLISGVAALAVLVLFAGVISAGFYLRSLHASGGVGQADVSPSPTGMPSDSATPTDTASPTAPSTEVASPLTRSPVPALGPPPPAHVAPSCPALVITSFTAQAAPRSVVLAWRISGGCGNETGWVQGSFAGTMYPGLWVVPIHASWKTYTDHPVKPAGSQGVCTFSLTYWIDSNGTAPGGGPVPASNAVVSDVNLC